MLLQQLWRERVGAGRERVLGESSSSGQAARKAKPAWAVESDRLWAGLLHEMAVTEPYKGGYRKRTS